MNTHRVTLVGYGRVGRALAQALTSGGWRVVSVGEHEDSPRVDLAVEEGYRVLPTAHIDLDVDLLVLALPDNEIAGVASQLAADWRERNSEDERAEDGGSRVVMHLSGRYGLEPLEPLREAGWERLAYHPIQTFPQDAGAERFHGVTAGLTADARALPIAQELASTLDMRIMNVAETERVRYHLASVWASNFLPLMLELGGQSLKGIAEDREHALTSLWPLMAGMLESLRRMPPEFAMSGPVVRNDLEAVLAHAETLEGEPRKLYLEMTRQLLVMAQWSEALSQDDIERWLTALNDELN